MRNTYIFVLIFAIFFLFQSCSPSTETPEQKSVVSPSQQKNSLLSESFSFNDFPLTDAEVNSKYTVQTTFFAPREQIKLLKKPATGVEAFQQTFLVPDKPGDTHVITLIALKFPDMEQCVEETRINFSILKNLLTKENLAIDSFAINTFGDESMGIVFTGKKYPLYLYCRQGTVLLKLNGGEKMQMEELVNLLKIIISKLN